MSSSVGKAIFLPNCQGYSTHILKAVKIEQIICSSADFYRVQNLDHSIIKYLQWTNKLIIKVGSHGMPLSGFNLELWRSSL